MLFHITFWRLKHFSTKLLCEDCTSNIQDLGIVEEKKLILFTDVLPDDAVPIFLNPPVLKDSKNDLTLFEAATKQIGDETKEDKTLMVGRDSWDGAKIGYIDKKLLQFKDKEVTLKKGLKLLEKVKPSGD